MMLQLNDELLRECLYVDELWYGMYMLKWYDDFMMLQLNDELLHECLYVDELWYELYMLN